MGRPFTQSFTKPSSAAALAVLCPELLFSAPLVGVPEAADLLSPRMPSPAAVPVLVPLLFAAGTLAAPAAAAAAPKAPGLLPTPVAPDPDAGDAAAQLALGVPAGPVLVDAGSTGDGGSVGVANSRNGAASPAPPADCGGLTAVGEFPIEGAFAAGGPRFAMSPEPLPTLGPVDPRLAIAAQLMLPPLLAFPSAGPVPAALVPPDACVGVGGDGADTNVDALAWGAAAGAGIAGAAVAGCCTAGPCAAGSTAASGSSGVAALAVGAAAVGATGAGAGAAAAAALAAATVGADVGGTAATAVTAGCVETMGAAIFGAAVTGVTTAALAMADVPVGVIGLMDPSCTAVGGGCPGCARLGCPMPAWDRSPCCGANPCCGGRASYSL